jgi:hypothetical protein
MRQQFYWVVTVTMVSMPVLVPRIGTIMFGIRIGILVVVSLVSTINNMLSYFVKASVERPTFCGQLVCPAIANTLRGL